ncbi:MULTISPECIES: hypothetical protein [Bacillaceae]|uniref:hypothetical protein n=1 Tax=Bacillaceae TaxID=186817 RepID=UPI000E70E2ED|nr:hypothetical protein [Bacillus sp. PK3_68]RJS62018.1 hypothetical protein CJ483_19840 [Bacillus sp. PK3_68]
MTKIGWNEAALEWHSDFLKIYDPSIHTYRKIRSLDEAKQLIKQSSEPFIRTAAAIYALSMAAVRATYTETQIFIAKLERESRRLKKMLSYSPFSRELLDHLLEAGKKSQSINGIKTDIYHEAIRLSIKIEDYFNIGESLKRRA